LKDCGQFRHVDIGQGCINSAWIDVNTVNYLKSYLSRATSEILTAWICTKVDSTCLQRNVSSVRGFDSVSQAA
jgi:hypothetical protein